MNFTIIPPKRPPRPIPAYRFINAAIWKVHCIATNALALEQQLPSIYLDFLLKLLADALRSSALRIEEQMALHEAERRAEHQRQLEARRNGNGPR
jgi:hypothetical protein